MKQAIGFVLAILTTCIISSVQSQTIDCNTDFLTITAYGDIQQWSLSSGIISITDSFLFF